MTVPEFSMTARTLFYIYIYSLHNIDKMSWELMHFEVLVYRNNMCSAVKWLMNLYSKNQMYAEIADVHHADLPWSWNQPP